jgi:hypothetical protein
LNISLDLESGHEQIYKLRGMPGQSVWRVYRAVLGSDIIPEESPYDKERLMWRIFRLLPGLCTEAVFDPLRRFLEQDNDLRKCSQLAGHLADLYDQYQVYRADWLEDWAKGENHLAHSRQREVEILQDQLLYCFEILDDLHPRDIIVMTQDIASYAPTSRRCSATCLSSIPGSFHLPLQTNPAKKACPCSRPWKPFFTCPIPVWGSVKPWTLSMLPLLPSSGRFYQTFRSPPLPLILC